MSKPNIEFGDISSIIRNAGDYIGDVYRDVRDGVALTDALATDYDERQVEKEYERAKEFLMWQYDYNSIVNQVDRMKRAGLNPAAVLSNGNPSTAGGLIPPPKANKAQKSDYSFLARQGAEAVGASIDAHKAKADIKLSEAQAEYWQAMADKEKPFAENAGTLFENALLSQANDISIGLYQSEGQRIRNQNMRIEGDILTINRNFTQSDWERRFRQYDVDYEIAYQELLTSEFRNEYMNDAQYQESCARAYNYWASGTLSLIQKDLVSAGITEKQINADLMRESYRHALVMNGVTEKYADEQQVMSLVGQGVGMLTDIADSAAQFINPFAGRKLSREQSRQQYEQFDAELQRKVAKDAQDYYLKKQGKQTLTTYGEGKKLEVTHTIP